MIEKAFVNSQEFKRLIESVSDFMGKENNAQYPYMNWIQLEIDKAALTVTAFANDGHKVAIGAARLTSATNDFACLIKKEIPIITKLCPDVVIELENGQVLLKAQERLVGYVQPLIVMADYKFMIDKHEQSKSAVTMISLDSAKLKKVINSIESDTISEVYIESEKDPFVIEFLNKQGLKEYRILMPVKPKTKGDKCDADQVE